ncbi:hypothetical protein [Frankia sp. Cppng1_Ct_nod]|uniref:hypothetical protein n=1 Tax=Frankia sp. Cppng1_Ct_nod TaxID=2897162 RepID=UPI0020254EBC|nr:hypothetical protein [Frankia sp. Cppng1_Ct_nod]
MTETDDLTTWLEIARVFDGYDQDGYGLFEPDHPRADAAEKERILGFLDAGELVVAARSRSHDQLDPDRGPIVPMVFLTDGKWVWSEAMNYYLAIYDLLPDPHFLAHIRTKVYQCPPVSREGAIRISEEFMQVRSLRHVDGDRRIGPPPRR